MNSFAKLLGFLLVVGLAARLLPGSELFVLFEVAFLAVFLRAGHRCVVKAAEARLRAQFNGDPDSDGARRLMIAAGYNV